MTENSQPPLDQVRLDAEWCTLVALREVLGMSQKGNATPTYQDAFALGKQLAPGLFASGKTLLGPSEGKIERIAREFQQRAEATQRLRAVEVTAQALLREEIRESRELLRTKVETREVEHRVRDLEMALASLQQNNTEHDAIARDVFRADHLLGLPSLPEPLEIANYRDFRLDHDRGLRIRMLHPNAAEQITGADVIYETYWTREHGKLGRLVFLQYKVWDRRTLYFSSAGNLEAQLEKMGALLCEQGYCSPSPNSKRIESYRLPFCSAFLRLTDRLQSPDAKKITSGYHVPICVVDECAEAASERGRKLTSKIFRSQCLSHKVFEDLFSVNMIGSRWLDYAEVERFYEANSIPSIDSSVVIHAREFDDE